MDFTSFNGENVIKAFKMNTFPEGQVQTREFVKSPLIIDFLYFENITYCT